MKPGSGSRRISAIIKPTNAVNSESAITRGLAKLMNWSSRSTSRTVRSAEGAIPKSRCCSWWIPQAENTTGSLKHSLSGATSW
jgi:hypothetical protein